MTRFPPRRILLALDGPPRARPAWRWACDLARRFGARLDAVHCDEALSPELAAAAGSPARREVLAERIRRNVPGLERLHVIAGRPSVVLPRLARDRRCDLIILGAPTSRGVARLVSGSTAEAVARAAPCPVLAVRGRPRPVRSILAPVHDLPHAGPALLAAAVVARAYRARLELLHVATDPIFGPRPEAVLDARLAQLPPALRRELKVSATSEVAADPPRAIAAAARGRDLVVLAEHRLSAVTDALWGTTAERVLRLSSAPVLLIPARKGARR